MKFMFACVTPDTVVLTPHLMSGPVRPSPVIMGLSFVALSTVTTFHVTWHFT